MVDYVFYFMNRRTFELSIAHDCGNVSSIVYDPYYNNFKVKNSTIDGPNVDVNCILVSETPSKY